MNPSDRIHEYAVERQERTHNLSKLCSDEKDSGWKCALPEIAQKLADGINFFSGISLKPYWNLLSISSEDSPALAYASYGVSPEEAVLESTKKAFYPNRRFLAVIHQVFLLGRLKNPLEFAFLSKKWLVDLDGFFSDLSPREVF